jgi:cation diffusion facilitator CzcD-associated flavoprotein CzcO
LELHDTMSCGPQQRGQQQRHVAVIGAGAAGLCTAKALLSHGHTVELFETQAEVGGTWVLRDPPAASSLYESLQTNTPKHKTAFPGVPFNDALPLRVPHADVLEYLEQYAADVLPLIQFEATVAQVRRQADQWEVLVEGKRQPRHFDAVAVCNGHYSVPYVPSLYADADAAGRVLHSHDYRRPDAFVGKRVMVVGAAGSANDIAPEIATVAAEVIRAHKSYADRASEQVRRLKFAMAIF